MALIEIINDHGTVLIDDEYSNAVLASKMTVVLTPTNSRYYMNIGYSSSEQAVMFAIGLDDIKVMHLASTRVGGVWTYTVHFDAAYVGRAITCYVFTIPSAIPDAGGIVQLRNAAGKLVFDSNMKYMRVVGFHSTTLSGSTTATNMIVGRSYAVIAVMSCYYNMHQRANPNEYAPPYSFIDQSSVALMSRSGNSLISSFWVTYQANVKADGPSSRNVGATSGQILLIDVTGF